MNVPARLALFAVAVAAALGLGYGLGTLAGPFDESGDTPAHTTDDRYGEHAPAVMEDQ